MSDQREPAKDEGAMAEGENCPSPHELLEGAPLAVIMLDRKGRVTLWNGIAEEMFGWTSAEVLGRFLPIVPKNLHGDFWDNFNKLVEGGHFAGLERPCLKKNGEIVDIGIAASAVKNKSGRIISFMSLLQDISGRKKLEREFQQAQKMEAIGRLAGGVAHDFNNILTAISGYASLLENSLSADDPNRADVQEISKAGVRAASLTRQLLAFSRQQVLQPRLLECNAIVSGIEKMLKRLIGEDVDVAVRLDQNLGRIMADPGQIEQVLMNLVINSRDAMPHGGKITIGTENVELKAESIRDHHGLVAGSYVMLSVSDTGSGMDAQTQARIFEPFFTTKEQGKGTGLGLATVYGIVKQSSGCIYVHSELGRGTIFKIYLPRTACGDVDKPVSRRKDKTLRGSETILYVEDNEAVRRLFQRALVEKGYAVLTAKDPEEAIAMSGAFRGPIPLLLTDMVMPKMHGRELAQRLIALRPDMKVIYMSGYTDQSIVQNHFLKAGQVFLQKPVPLDALLTKVREILDGDPPSSIG
ncbi:MAG: response regulator [Elusimicrobia bacterium]|nr:response regulator [Elusimicrobiota bacterium]